jgi:hypothetical protein
MASGRKAHGAEGRAEGGVALPPGLVADTIFFAEIGDGNDGVAHFLKAENLKI